jgi:hypothetical protein
MNGSVAGLSWCGQAAGVTAKFNVNINLREITSEFPAKIRIKNRFTALITEEAEQYQSRIWRCKHAIASCISNLLFF